MDQNIQYLILGAGLTLITSIILAIISNILVVRINDKNRLSLIRDGIRKERTKKIEEFVSRLSKMAHALDRSNANMMYILKQPKFRESIKYTNYVKLLTDKEVKTGKKAALYVIKEKMDWKSLNNTLKTNLSFLGKSRDELEGIQRDLDIIHEELHIVYAYNNEFINDKVTEFYRLIVDQSSQSGELRKKLLSDKKIYVSREEKRQGKFLDKCNKIHGAILNELEKSMIS